MYFIVLTLFILLLIYIQSTGRNCYRIFRNPYNLVNYESFNGNPSLRSNNVEKFDNKEEDPINDRVNVNYMGNPYLSFPKKEGMGDISKSLWGSISSHPVKTNDGSVVAEEHMISEMATPNFLSKLPSKLNEKMQASMYKSKVGQSALEKKN